MPVFAIFGFGPAELLFLAAVVGGATVLAVTLIAIVLLSRKEKVDPDAGLAEDLSEYPPAPKSGTHRLVFEGQPARLRLVVLAPAGRGVDITPDMAEGLLQAVLHGLGEVADLDRPRIKVWPGQLSSEGFAPKFFDNIARRDPARSPSKWVLVAGPAKAGQKTICVGLALQTSEPTTRGNVKLGIDGWTDKFRVQVSG